MGCFGFVVSWFDFFVLVFCVLVRLFCFVGLWFVILVVGYYGGMLATVVIRKWTYASVVYDVLWLLFWGFWCLG